MKETNYYKLWFSESDPLAARCKQADLKGVSEYFVYQPKPVADWPEGITFYSVGEHIEDYLFPIMVDWILVSERVRLALEGMGVQGVQFLPVRVVRQERDIEIPDYYVLHVWNQISALDEKHTVYLEPRHEKHPELSIVKVALRREAVGGLDIFRIKEDPVSVYVSKRVKERLEEIGATGFKWIPVPSY